MRFFYLFALLFSLGFAELSAQNKSEFAGPHLGKRKFLFGFDSRNSFIEDKRSKIFGIRMGIQSKNGKVRYGLGLYNMRDDIKRLNEKVAEFPQPLDTLRLDYGFFSVFYERVIYTKGNFEMSVPIQLGAGEVARRYFDEEGKLVNLEPTGIQVIESSLSAQYKFLPWIGLGSGLGYNLVFSKQKEVSKAFNSPFYVFKIKLFLGELYRGLRKKKSLK